ncbi:unnamed protein product, partial [Laminaria digitata]
HGGVRVRCNVAIFNFIISRQSFFFSIFLVLIIRSHLLYLSYFSIPPPFRNSDPGVTYDSGHSSPLPPTGACFHFYRQNSSAFFFPRQVTSNSVYMHTLEHKDA